MMLETTRLKSLLTTVRSHAIRRSNVHFADSHLLRCTERLTVLKRPANRTEESSEASSTEQQ